MLGAVARISSHASRDVMKRFVRNGSQGGVVGENLPFDVHNRKMLAFHMFWFVGSSLGAPFLITLYQMKKNST